MIPYYKTDNCSLYQCDNLELMKILPDNYIDLIYCDILYNTGRKFKDYNDNLGTPQQAIEWYEPRLFEMRRILKENGSIYIHADFRLIHYMKVKMDEIFGFDYFINEIIWHYDQGARSKSMFGRKHDNILYYSKSRKYTFNVNNILEPFSSGMTRWRYQKGGQINKEMPKGKVPSDVWNINFNTMSSERLGYDTQKPKQLLEKIIKASSNENDIIADFFMGSATTGDVALKLNRKFIGCDIGDNACKISKERLDKYNKK